MYLQWLELRDFRSYGELAWSPDPGVNLLVGDNGAGKTNVLEAIGYLSSLRSFRRAPEPDLVRSGEERAVIRGGVARASGELRVEIEIPATGRRRILVNGKRPRRHADVAFEVPLVAFLPDDLDLVKRGPAIRREYLDLLGEQLGPVAGANVTEYEKAVRQRNSLLRREGPMVDRMSLEAWDERVASAGALVLDDRLRLLRTLGPVLGDAYATLGDGGALSVEYRSSWAPGVDPADPPGAAAEAWLRAALEARRPRDLEQRTTSAGPHRDEPVAVLDGRGARTQASQGEQRSAALAMRLAAYRLLRERHQVPPILLLDDVLSELDARRSAAVMELLPEGQVFVTTARDDDARIAGRRWRVTPGEVA